MDTIVFAPKDSTRIDCLDYEHLASGVKEFLKIANETGNQPIESLPILAARQALIDSQKAFNTDYSGIEETEKEIETDSFRLKLNLVRPESVEGDLGVGSWVTIQPTDAWLGTSS